MRVLIVEDDVALGTFLSRGLGLDGHEVALVGDGIAALDCLARAPPELMILDLGLPRKDGTEVLAEMRRQGQSTSVLVLTGRSEMEERVRCLELGADDIVLKPFSFHELRARCRAISRRRARFADSVLRFGELVMDRTERRVKLSGREIELTTTEFSLLEALLRRGAQVSTRAELLREVWQMPGEGASQPQGAATNIVEVYINYLRKKLGQSGGGEPLIRTVRGKGYALVGTEAAAQRQSEEKWPEAAAALPDGKERLAAGPAR